MTKTLLITGASSGIGRASALSLAASGFTVLGSVRTEVAAEELKRLSDGTVEPVQLDIADDRSVEEFLTHHADKFESEGLFGLVNNAGHYALGSLELTPIESWRKTFDVNFFGHVHLTQKLLPYLRQSKGRIVFVGSLAGRVAFPIGGAYCASKYALEGMTDSLRRELHGFGVKVSLVEPGTVETRMLENSDQAAESVIASATKDEFTVYRKLGEGVKKVVRDFRKMASKPEKVVGAIHHALTTKNPKSRYSIGLDCKSQLFIDALTSDKVMDAFLRKMMAP